MAHTKDLMNRMYNVGNPAQGEDKKVLCVCSAGLLRSPTAARVLQNHYGYNTRSAGINRDYALIILDEVLLVWADEVVCMDQNQADVVKLMLEGLKRDGHNYEPDIKVLNIPDVYQYGDKELIDLIKTNYKNV